MDNTLNLSQALGSGGLTVNSTGYSYPNPSPIPQAYADTNGNNTFNFNPSGTPGLTINSTGGSVLGTNTQNNTSSGNTGGSGQLADLQRIGVGNLNPAQKTLYDQLNNAQNGQPAQPSIDFDALIRPAIDALNQYIPVAQGQYNTDVGDINNQNQLQTQQANTQTSTEQGLLDNTQQQQTNQAQNADLQQRQAQSEIQQGLQARYGGTTGTGAFASELSGRTGLQNLNQIHQGLANAIQDIGVRKQHVAEVGQQAILQINNQTGSLLNQAKDRLDGQLADIRNQQGQLQSQKAQMALQAMTHYQDTVNQVNSQNAAFRQNIVLQAQQAQSQLAIAQQYAHAYTQNTSGVNLPGMQTTPVGGGLMQAIQQPQQSNAGSSNGQFSMADQGGQLTKDQLAQADASQGGQLDTNYLKNLFPGEGGTA